MTSAGLDPDVVSYSTVIDACAKAGDTDRAQKTFKLMTENKVEPTIVTFTSLARPYAHHGRWKEDDKIAEQVAEHKLQINEYFLNVMLIAYANANPVQKF